MKTTGRQILGMAAKLALISTVMRNGALPAFAEDSTIYDAPAAFDDDFVRKQAEALSKKPWDDVKIAMPPEFEGMTYGQYRDIRFNPGKSVWKGEPHGFSFDLFRSGFLFKTPVDIYVVGGDQQARIKYSSDLFNFGPQGAEGRRQDRHALCRIAPALSDQQQGRG